MADNGLVNIVSVEYWNPATGSYQATPPTLTAGQEAGVRVTTHNETVYTLVMRVDVGVIAPDNSSQTLTGANQWVSAGDTAIWEGRWACSQTGTYRASIALYAGSHLDYMDMTDTDVSDAAYVQGVLDPLMPIIGMVMALGILGTMMRSMTE